MLKEIPKDEMTMKVNSKIATVVVTYNRLELLKRCVESLKSQTRKPDELIVVNNNSTDGTFEWLSKQNDITVINQENLGGAGGFYSGIKAALEKGHNWIWCMDDDTIAKEDALSKLVEFILQKDEKIGFVTSKVLWIDGTDCKMNVLQPDNNKQVTHASFVSILISSYAVEKVGFPIKEFFIYYDDAEYTFRISSKLNCYYVEESVVTHYRKSNDTFSWSKININNSQRYFYAIRNLIFFNRNDIGGLGMIKCVSEIITFSLRAIAGIIIPSKSKKVQLMLRLILAIKQGFVFNPSIEQYIKQNNN